MNPYHVLQVSETASPEVIRAAWAALIRECHPDGPKPDAARCRKFNEAYALLKDAQHRSRVDEALKIARQHAAKPGHFGQVPPEDCVPAYPPAYMGFSQEDIDDAIETMTKSMPPFAKLFMKAAARAARKTQ